MKFAYVSLVLSVNSLPSSEILKNIDQLLSRTTRAHELLLLVPYGVSTEICKTLRLTGLLTVISVHTGLSHDEKIVAGLARAVGDFVIDWRGNPEDFDAESVDCLLGPTDVGIELVEILQTKISGPSRFFYRVVNALRPAQAAIRKTVARMYSRNALQQVLVAFGYERQLDTLTAELPVKRIDVIGSISASSSPALMDRVEVGLGLLSKGTRFGSVVPLFFAATTAFLAICASIYAITVLLVRRQTPEGWTTLMVVMGFGQATILTLLGLVWARMDSLIRGLSRTSADSSVMVVHPPDESSHSV